MKNLAIASTLVLFSFNAFASNYTCTFQKSGGGASNYGGTHVFSDDAPDATPLPCGTVNQRWVKLSAWQLVPSGQLTISWGNNAPQTLGGGYFEVKVFKVSQNDGQACSTQMEISLSGSNLYYGPPLQKFSASSLGNNTGSGVSELVWVSSTSSQINKAVYLSTFDGTSSFTCAAQ